MQIIFAFYVYLLPVTNKRFVRMIKYDSFLPKSLPTHIRLQQMLMPNPRSMNLSIKVNAHVHQDSQKSF